MVSPVWKVRPSLQTLETEVLRVYKALRMSVFLEPKKLKVDELKEDFKRDRLLSTKEQKNQI